MEPKDIFKFVLLIVALPWVVPFIKALARDLLQAFEEDGGLLGDPPQGEKLEAIRREKFKRPNPLVNEPLAHIKRAAAEQRGSDSKRI